MRICSFPGCERLPHARKIQHAAWIAEVGEWVPLKEQRRTAQVGRERRAEIRREDAERIARRVQAQHGTDYRRDGWFCDCGHPYGIAPAALALVVETHRMTAAVLAGLTEKENA